MYVAAQTTIIWILGLSVLTSVWHDLDLRPTWDVLEPGKNGKIHIVQGGSIMCNLLSDQMGFGTK